MSDSDARTNIGPWKVSSRKNVFENPWIKIVDHDVVHPDGSDGKYGVVRFKNLAIGILPLDAEGYTWIVGQHRFPADRYSWELPEGGGPLGCDPLESAKRELMEETGLSAENWAALCAFDISNSVTDERALCYIATNLSEGPSAPDPSEELNVKRVPFNELFEKVMTGEISDSMTQVMVLTAYAKALRGALPRLICRIILSSIEIEKASQP